MWIALDSLLQAQYSGTKPTQADLGYIQCQLQVDHSRFYSLKLYLSLMYAEGAAIHCRPSVDCS